MKLNTREKYAMFAAGGAVLLFIILQFVVTPFMERRERLKMALAGNTKVLEEMIALSHEYETMRRKTEASKARYAKRDPRFTLFSFLDGLTGKARIKGNITYMRPSHTIGKEGRKISKVEMKMKNVSMEQINTYLHMVETSENMALIKRISITKSNKKGEALDVTLLVETVST